MSEAIIVIGLIIFSIILLLITSYGLSHEENIKKWATENELEILNLKECKGSETSFNRLLTARDARYFLVKVKEKNGTVKSGKLWTSGSFFNSIYRMPPRVVWDENGKTS